MTWDCDHKLAGIQFLNYTKVILPEGLLLRILFSVPIADKSKRTRAEQKFQIKQDLKSLK